MSEKIILFGGTFDPVHIGHIEVASSAARTIGASTVFLIPARRSPHKQNRPLAADDDRIAMLKLAVEGNSLFQISPVELNRAEPSFTIDTIRYFKQKFGAERLFYWLIGADMLKDFPKWYKIDELLRECTVCVMNRGGFDSPDFQSFAAQLGSEAVEKLRQNQIETPMINISSTVIRQRLLTGQDVSEMINPAVLKYIQKHKLYGLDHQLSKYEEF